MSKNDQGFSPLFLLITCLFVTCLLISNIIAGKLASFGGIVLPAAVVLFPVTYIIGDVLTEVYGYARARMAIWIGFAANLFMITIFMLTVALPYPAFWKGQAAYQIVLGLTPRLVVASLAAYLAGEFLNSLVLSKLKLATKGRWLWVRTIGSTLVGEGVDTLIFLTVAFYGAVPLPVLFEMMLGQYLWKVGYEAAVTPITYLFVKWVKTRENLDSFDDGVKYNPFRIGVK